jgi:ElaB/YqjD/DUF883 family membrane-anchored ribosome-binding protein
VLTHSAGRTSSCRCASLREALSSFRDANNGIRSRSINDIHASRSIDEADTATNDAELTTIASDVTKVLTAIGTHCKETHDQLAEKLANNARKAKDFDSDLEKEVDSVKTSMADKLDELRGMVHDAEVRITEWSKTNAGALTSRSLCSRVLNSALVFRMCGST